MNNERQRTSSHAGSDSRSTTRAKKFRPWLLIPADWAHEFGPLGLAIYSHLFGKGSNRTFKSFMWKGLFFKNRFGIAGGVDKNAEQVEDWWRLGAGFIEIGTVTMVPQDANPGTIISRDIASESLWNKMGFPSDGAREVHFNLRNLPYRHSPIFVNIGKNRNTANANAEQDYLNLIEELHEVADVFVINISSPNTSGLRELQSKENLSRLLTPILNKAKNYSTPVLLKLSPDLDKDALAEALLNSHELGIDGWILANTTLTRPADVNYPAEGGMSGRPLGPISKQVLQWAVEILGSKRQGKLIVSVGGVMSAEDAFERLQLGADLVQIYSGLVYNGPGFLQEILAKAEKTFSK